MPAHQCYPTMLARRQHVSGRTLLCRASLHVLESSCAVPTYVREMEKQACLPLHNDSQMLQCNLAYRWLETGCPLGEGSWSSHTWEGTASETLLLKVGGVLVFHLTERERDRNSLNHH